MSKMLKRLSLTSSSKGKSDESILMNSLGELEDTTASSSMFADKLTSSPWPEGKKSAVTVKAVYKKSTSFTDSGVDDETGGTSALEMIASQTETARRKQRRGSMPDLKTSSTLDSQGLTGNFSRGRRKSSGDKAHMFIPLNADFFGIQSIMKIATQAESLSRTSTAQLDKWAKPRGTQQILFGPINVREYERELGDNPSCASGPPLTIGWRYKEREDIADIDDFERRRIPERKQNLFQLILPVGRRWEICQDELDCSETEIAAAAELATAVRRRRMAVAKDQSWFADVMEEVRRGAWSKLKKTVTVSCNSGGSSELIKAYVARDQQLLHQYQTLKREDQKTTSEKKPVSVAINERAKAVRRTSLTRISRLGKAAGERIRRTSLNSADSVKSLDRVVEHFSDLEEKVQEDVNEPDEQLTKEEEEELLRYISNVRGFFRHRDSMLDVTMMVTKDGSSAAEHTDRDDKDSTRDAET